MVGLDVLRKAMPLRSAVASQRGVLWVRFGDTLSNSPPPVSAPEHPAWKAFQPLMLGMENIKEMQNLLSWDLGNAMAPAGTENRVYQLGTLASVMYQLQTSPEMAQVLGMLNEPTTQSQLTPAQRRMVSLVSADVARTRKIPKALFEGLIMAKALTNRAWMQARAANDFSVYAPALENLVSLHRQMAEATGYTGSPYDVLLETYEPGMTVAKLDPLFAEVKAGLTPLMQAVFQSKKKPDNGFFSKRYSLKKAWKFGETLIRQMGLKPESSRLKEGPSAYFLGLGRGDGALSLAMNPKDFFSSLSSFTHEGGHGLYYQNIAPDFTRTPLQGPASYGMDEAQARLMENVVGRGKPYWKHHFAKLKQAFPKQFQDISFKRFYEAINTAKATMNRGDADELTYNLHIILRYELEKALFEGRLAVKDLPAAWNAKMKEALGITPKNDNEGVMQDIHWSYGYFGYFPSYTLGNLYSVQLYETAKKQVPDLEKSIAKGNLAPLTQWLSKNIHEKGKLYSTDELMMQVTGEALNPQYWLNYLWAKLTPIYKLKRPGVAEGSI